MGRQQLQLGVVDSASAVVTVVVGVRSSEKDFGFRARLSASVLLGFVRQRAAAGASADAVDDGEQDEDEEGDQGDDVGEDVPALHVAKADVVHKLLLFTLFSSTPSGGGVE